MKINAISLTNLQNTEASQFNTDILGIIQLNNPITLGVVKPYEVLKNEQTEILSLFKADKSSALTDELVTLDLYRDEALIGISLQIESYTYHKLPATRALGVLLFNHLNNFGTGIDRYNYQKETSTITNILKEWKDKTELKAALVALKLTDWENELEATNMAFNTKFIQRAQVTGENTFTNTLKAKRIDAAQAWYKLRDAIVSKYTVALNDETDTSIYVTTINSINAVIDKYNALLAARRKKKTTPPVVTPES
ncbi:MAG: DUF6261 family protein [Flavobacterium sp.]|nr:DUF6261 family protein [Flavobacterium sp.]